MSNITIRRAVAEDLMRYFNWANDERVRQNAISTDYIQLERHKSWFEKKLHNKDTFMYVFEIKKEPFGQVRFDVEDKIAFIDYSIAINFRGKKLGKKMLEMAIIFFSKKAENKCQKIVGIVKKSNIPSKKIFRNLGFDLQKESIIKEEVYKFYQLKVNSDFYENSDL